ncbi:glycoside hydrolase family 127 protein [Sphingobacterium oryzagri]|uniref:Glycoside hydrolase family 127 protein n=1 Tax=Sphingobacterium oryzagri TaxID=3025669 RepID=A0ABY7WL90_9SPHI|nr:beta-L-arabinofuranosidase domain-containing protein [Sphingobacterium sp. KACC 22765]WDF69750.1 glycoside hydrolase family 127 protein [Sphingobacterium sp. KACC 22765]
MKMYNLFLRVILLALLLSKAADTVQAQSGDQILDGIGETSMIARYVFDGDVRDWSRNNLHSTFHGGEAKFVQHEQFGKVLSLAGGATDYLSLPAEALNDLESISISGWLYLKSDQAGQYFFDFGQSASKHFFAAPLGTGAKAGFQASITANESHRAAASANIIANKWVHLAIVVDIPSKTLITYVDSKPVGETKAIPAELTEVFGKQADTKRQLFIGKSLLPDGLTLKGMLHDFRIYRVPLSRKQITGIYYNALKDLHEDVSNMGKTEDDLPSFSLTKAQLYNAYLSSVSNVSVETQIGDLPRLPSYVSGTYKDNMAGPKVRVLWPSPTDNHAVQEAGTYTVTGRVPGTDFQPKAVITVKGKGKTATPNAKLATFSLDQVALNSDAEHHDTKFIENRDKFIRTLATTDPNAFLYMFRHAFGQPQPQGAKPLGVWDSQDTKLRGHATGHYLTAIAQAYAGTGYDKALQANFADKMTYMVNSLYELAQLSGKAKESGSAFVSDPTAVPKGSGKADYDSDLSTAGIRTDYWNWGTGFISAYPPDQFIMLEHGAKYGGQKNQVWAPYYTLHKILAGLMDVYEVSGNEKALAVAAGMGNWVYARLSKLPTETLIKMWNTYIAGEFGGMNESMARLYAITKEPNYLKTAQLFDNIAMFYGDAEHAHGLAKNVDTFRGLHANQHIPQIVGSMELYRVSDNPDYYKIADNFWYKAVNDYMYSIGGVAGARNPANAECFISQPASLYENGFSAGGQNETCATYNMLKLTSNLFQFDQRTELMDYYERGLYNHILASVAEDSPANTYHVPLRPGSIKQFGNPHMNGFTCCNGTAIESSTKLQNSIYFKSKDDKALYVNLYIPSTLEWTERNVVVEQTTSFPKEDQTRLTIKGQGKFDVHVRVPGWATKGFFVTINGKLQKVDAKAGSYLKLSRNWKNGDVIELKMPFQFHLDPVMDQPNIASLFYGPILLAAQEPEARKDWRKVTFDANDIGKTISGDPNQLEFTIDGVLYKPFYDTYGRHSVYLDVTLN